MYVDLFYSESNSLYSLFTLTVKAIGPINKEYTSMHIIVSRMHFAQFM